MNRCTLPLTGAGVVDMVITDLGVFTLDRHGGGLTLIELAPDVTLDDLKAKTQASFKVANTLHSKQHDCALGAQRIDHFEKRGPVEIGVPCAAYAWVPVSSL